MTNPTEHATKADGGGTGSKSGLAIDATGLSRTFGSLQAVDKIDLRIEKGQLFSLLGPNGAGKTTAIKMLCCLLQPTGGTAQIMGHDIEQDPLAVKRIIAVSPQETAIAEHLSAKENLQLMAGLHGIDKEQTRRQSGELLEMMGLSDRATERVRNYSGGMKRRLSIAMALVSNPQVLFLDEPTLGLDPQSRRTIWNYIELLKNETTIVLTTHYLEEADALADRVAIIDDGKIVIEGSPDELKASIAGAGATVVEAEHITTEAYAALERRFGLVRAIEGGVELDGEDVTLFDIEDCLRPLGVLVNAVYTKQVTLDDVFLQLTGKELRS